MSSIITFFKYLLEEDEVAFKRWEGEAEGAILNLNT